MTDFTASAKEVFQLLQSYDYTVMLYGETGNRVEDPGEARRMFARPENLLVSLIDDGDDSCIRLYIGQKTKINDILGLLMSLRTSASKYNLLFNVRQYGREIEPKDFAGEAMTEARRISKMDVFEGMYGTSRSSYLKLENARMIVRHSTKVDETKVGARSRFVESIFVENAAGERMLFPTNNLAPARAMTQHVNLGGQFADLVGQQITRMANDFSNLGACASYVNNNATMLPESAGAIREQCRTKMREMKKTFERMYRSENGYMTEAKKLEDAARTLTENDDGDCVPAEKIEELRKNLNLENSSLLSDGVFESVCKCCNLGINEESPTDNENNSKDNAKDRGPATVSVLGREVDKSAWEELKNNKIELIGDPDLSIDTAPSDLTFSRDPGAPKGFSSKTGELVYKLGAIVPMVKNDSLMNLLSYVADRMPEERDPEVAKKMRTLALYVVKAVGLSMNEGIAEGSKAIIDLSRWLAKFEPGTALWEYGYGSNPNDRWDNDLDRAIEDADDDFDVSEFLASRAGKDLLSGHFKHDEDDEMTVHEVKHAIQTYLEHYVDVHFGKTVEDLDWLADKKLGEVIAHLAYEGYKVAGDNDHDDEDDGADGADGADEDNDETDETDMLGMEHRQILDDDNDDDMTDMEYTVDECDYAMSEDQEMDECDLTREDILLPHPNAGEDLAREVTPRVVKDPDTGDNTQPDSAYMNRLRALSGLSSPNRQF